MSSSSPSNKPNPLKVVSDLYKDHPTFRRFAFQVAVLGLVTTLSDTVLPVQIELLEGTRTFNGLSTLVGILGGVPFFWYSASIYSSKGVWFMLRASTVLLAARLVCMSLVRTSDQFWILLIVQPLHGASFSLMLTGAMEHLATLASEMYGTTSTVVNTLFFTVGHGIGNVLWMKLLELNGNDASDLYLLGAAALVVNLAAGGTREGDWKKAAGEHEGGSGITMVETAMARDKSEERRGEEAVALIDKAL